MISFQNISKKFGDGTYGVSNITLDIPEGDFVFLVGQSGAGKTTLLKLLIGQMKPTEGTILVDDMNVTKLKQGHMHKLRRKIGVVFQDFKLLPDQTVYENVALALEVIGKNEKKCKQQIMDIIQSVGLAGKERYFPMQLSGGELQRTAIARALATQAKILIADEPTGDLDPKTSWEILTLLDQINKNGTTIIMATHNHTIVDEMRKRVITIDHGRVMSDVQHGGYSNPVTEEQPSESVTEAAHEEIAQDVLYEPAAEEIAPEHADSESIESEKHKESI